MKLLAFADLHNHLPAMKHLEKAVSKHKPDLIICAGDFTVFEHHIGAMARWLDKLGRPALVLHGNHEMEEHVRALCRKSKHLTFIHEKIVTINGITFVGHGGGGFSTREPGFERFVKKHAAQLKRDYVLVTHAPPRGTTLDKLPFGHVGCTSYADAIKKTSCKLAISGHIHETFGKIGRLGDAVIINPGPAGKVIQL
jgi:hypothetical protein